MRYRAPKPSCSICMYRDGDEWRCICATSPYNGKRIKAWHSCREYEEIVCPALTPS
jgi:hypothetical protein